MQEISATTIALGGEDLVVQLRAGGTATVRVQLLKIAEFPSYLLCATTNEETLAELLCNKKPGWAAGIHPLSLAQILTRGHELNFAAVRLWVEWRTKMEADSTSLLKAAGMPTPSAK